MVLRPTLQSALLSALLAATLAPVGPSPRAQNTGSSTARANQPPINQPQVVTLGTHLRLQLQKEGNRVAVGDESVLSFELLTTTEALILGKSVGTTSVLVWNLDGTHETLLYRVQRDLSLLQGALDEISPGISAQMAPDRDALVLRGVVPDELHRQAIVRAARNYMAAPPTSDLAVEARDASGGSAPAEVQVAPDATGNDASAQVIDLLRLETLPATLEQRVLDAIRPIAGDDIRVRRLQRDPLSDDDSDVLVLEGSVSDQIALMRSMQLAARLYLGENSTGDTTDTTIEVLADETGGSVSRNANQLNQGGGGQGGGGRGGGGGGFGGGGGGGGFAGGGAIGVRNNQIQRNLGRATVLSMARGRILSFVEVRDRPQVRVGVQLFEIDRDRLFQFASEIRTQGSDFRQPPLEPSLVGSDIQTNPANVGQFSDSDIQAGLTSLATGFSQQIQLSGRNFALDTLLQALEARGIARRLSSPVLTVLNGETAQFQVGGEVPIPQAFTPAAGAGSGLGTFSSVEFRAFGVGLGVRPLVGRDGAVTLDISSIVSQPDEGLTTVVRAATGTNPQTTAFSSRVLQTNAQLQDGQSLLIGGLVSRSITDDLSKTPVLGDIPLIGWLFRSANDAYSESELFVLVTPSVVRPAVAGSELWMQPSLGEMLGRCVPKQPRKKTSSSGTQNPPTAPSR